MYLFYEFFQLPPRLGGQEGHRQQVWQGHEAVADVGEGPDLSLIHISYDLPEGCDGAHFTYENMPQTPYGALKPSSKFTPARYRRKDGAWEGGSVSMFSPALKFTLWERFSPEVLEVSETMEVNGKRTMGYDRPILYKRK